jgi:DNA polymerase III subunit beta
MIKGEVTAKPQVFAAAVKWAAKFVAAKPVEPVQAGLTLEAQDGYLTVTAFNENVTARATLPVDGDGAGRAVVSGRLLAELVGTFPDKPVSISGDAGDQELVTVTAGRWRGTLPAMDETQLPDLPTEPPVLGVVSGEAFAQMIGKVAVAASKDVSKQIALACVHLTFGGGEVVALATDSYRAASAAAPFLATGQAYAERVHATALVLAAPMVEVANSFLGPDNVQVGIDEHRVSLTSATRSIVLRQMGEEYNAVAVRAFFAQASALPEHVSVSAADLLQPLKRAALVRAKDGPIRVGFGSDVITLSAAAEDIHQDCDEEIDARYSGPDHTLAFNPRMFAEAIASVPGETVELTMTTERVTGVMLTTAGDATWKHVLMPLKIQ